LRLTICVTFVIVTMLYLKRRIGSVGLE